MHAGPGTILSSLPEVDALVDAPTPARGGLAPWQERRVRWHIESSISSSLRMLDVAALARLSPSYFSRAFKCSFGEPFSTYVVRRRLQLARDLMLASTDTICRIAMACGFADQAHLSRVFRRAEGVAPTLWRRAHREPRPLGCRAVGTYTKV